MRNSLLFFTLIALFIAYFQFQVHAAAPAGKTHVLIIIIYLISFFFFSFDAGIGLICTICYGHGSIVFATQGR